MKRFSFLILSALLLNPAARLGAQEAEASPENAEVEAVPAAETVQTPEAPEAPEEVTRLQALIGKIKQGKEIGVVLILLSVFAVAVALERAVGLKAERIVPKGFAKKADELYQAGKIDELRVLCEQHPSVLAHIVDELVQQASIPHEEARLLAEDVGSYELKLQQQRNYPLLVVGSVAPLLGLTGTVFGMIQAFEDVAALGSLGDPRVLADGISQALVTTAMGLIVAVPSLVLYHFFKSRLIRASLQLQKQTTRIIRRWYGSAALTTQAAETETADV
ncbi:MAG: MotA/TolQ/ExbB proton channel family protein [Opitutales bacterium]